MDQVNVAANSEEQDKLRLARVLRLLIWGAWGVYLFVIITGLFYKDLRLVAVTLAGCALLGVPMLLIRRRQLRTSSLLLVLIVLVTVTFIATIGQGIRDLAIVSFPIILIFAGLALDRLFFRVCVGMELLAVCWLVFGEALGWFTTQPFQGDMTNWFYLIGLTIILLVAAWALELLATSMHGNLELARSEVAQRKQAEEALRASQQFLSDLVENCGVSIYTKDCQGRYQLVNKQWETGNGIKREFAIGKTDQELFPREIADEYRTNDLQVMALGSRLEAEETNVSQAGMNYYLSVKIPLRDEDNVINGIFGISTEITERKQAEERLQASEERFRSLVENATIGIYQTTPGGQILMANPALVRMLGYESFDELSRRDLTIDSFEPDNARHEFQQHIEQDGEVRGLEGVWKRKDGTFIFVRESAHLVRDEKNQPHYYQGTVEDITARKRAERERGERFKELQGLYNLSKLIEKEDLTPDELFQEYMGILPNSWQYPQIACTRMVIGDRQFSSDNFIESAWMLSSPIKVIGSIQGSIEVGYLEQRPEASEGPFLKEERMLMDAIAERLGHFIERKQAQQALQNYNARLEEEVDMRTRELRAAQEKLIRQEKLAVLGQMAGSVGHELRNPLGVINTAVYYLKLVQPQANEKIKKHLGIIEQEVHNANMIITDLLDFARVKSLQREQVSVGTLVHDTLERFPVPAGVELTLDLPDDLPGMFVDSRQVEQVLGNLMTNACQAMATQKSSATGVATQKSSATGVVAQESTDMISPEAGSTTGLVSDGQLVVTSEQSGENGRQWVRIAVKDTGTGIPPENMGKLFEPLFTTKPRGIGLGLPICKKLAEANGGRIEVDSEVGVGSTFTLVLPVEEK